MNRARVTSHPLTLAVAQVALLAALAAPGCSGGGGGAGPGGGNPAADVTDYCNKAVMCGATLNGQKLTLTACESYYDGWVPPAACRPKVDAAACADGDAVNAVCFPPCKAQAPMCNGNRITVCRDSGTQITVECSAVCSANQKTYAGACASTYQGQTSQSGDAVCWCK
jgi:hypothetical protein